MLVANQAGGPKLGLQRVTPPRLDARRIGAKRHPRRRFRMLALLMRRHAIGDDVLDDLPVAISDRQASGVGIPVAKPDAKHIRRN